MSTVEYASPQEHNAPQIGTLVFLMRAVSGSGKSTLARSLQNELQYRKTKCVILSTDDKFIVDGEYRFDPMLLAQHHNQTREEFIANVQAQTPVVILDNTNLSFQSIQDYHGLCQEYGAHCSLIQFEPLDAEVQVQRCVHGVPLANIVYQMESFVHHQPAITALPFDRQWWVSPQLSLEQYQTLLAEIVQDAISFLRGTP